MSDSTAQLDTVNDLRAILFATLRDVRDGKIDLDRAKAVNALAATLVDTARVEVDFIRATDASESKFLAPPDKPLPAGITAITQHRAR